VIGAKHLNSKLHRGKGVENKEQMDFCFTDNVRRGAGVLLHQALASGGFARFVAPANVSAHRSRSRTSQLLKKRPLCGRCRQNRRASSTALLHCRARARQETQRRIGACLSARTRRHGDCPHGFSGRLCPTGPVEEPARRPSTAGVHPRWRIGLQ